MKLRSQNATIVAAIAFAASSMMGCAAPEHHQVNKVGRSVSTTLRDGAWLGSISATGISADDTNISKDGKPMLHTSVFLVMVCDGNAVFLSQRSDGSFHATVKANEFSIRSNHGNHLIFFDHFDDTTRPEPDWAETQTMALVELDGDLRAQWSRAVSNLHVAPGDKIRNFFWHGVGTLREVSRDCPREMLQTRVDD